MSKVNEETRGICPRCKSASVGPGEKVCSNCAGKKPQMPHQVKEMGVGAQLPLGSKMVTKEMFDKIIAENRDLSEGHVVVFLKSLRQGQVAKITGIFEAGRYDLIADLIREHVVRLAVRKKITEVVRKKAGGGGYTLYAPNKGKKHGAKPVGTFPTKLAAKRAELARFPPKDPKKLMRLRKEVDKLLKDPKKRAEAEKKALQQHGTDTPHKAHKAGHARGHHLGETKMLTAILTNEIKRRALSEGLFREEAQSSEWDEFIKKVSQQTIEADKGFQRVMKKLGAETNNTLSQSLKIVQKQLGANAKVKPMGTKKTDDGRSYVTFQIQADSADVGPAYVYSDNGVPKIELSDNAKSAFAKVSPGTATAIRGALATAQDALEKHGGLRDMIAQRDQYLSALEGKIDKSISTLSPLGLAMAKRLLVKKYRGGV